MATQSLYRRYRPRRFAEIKGQDHVVRALRDSVASGREGQAYLFSGPRGTGKTTSARILAKVLNCERPVDGEPCCECSSCLEVERGVSYDVHELDAASNNGVEAMRDLIEKAQLGTPGRHKVYILDEVHMLSKPAEAALLKTLEEPPSHVVFVLATTDPQKVSDTIRSRTQHLRFHLLAPDTLAEHVRWVAADAGLDVGDDAITAAVSQGAGSARDALSALELIASSGGDVGEHLRFDEFVEALIAHDAGQALTAMAALVNAGHDPRTVAEELVRHLRDGFLSLMAPELVQLPSGEVDALASQCQRLGAPRLVAAIERFGEMLVELRHAPDPRVLVEVTLVQLARADTGAAEPGDVEALTARIAKLERQVAALGAAAPATASPPVDPTTGRARLGGRAERAAATAAPTPTAAPATAAPAPAAAAPAPATQPEPPPVSETPPSTAPAPAPVAATPAGDAASEWVEVVRPSLSGLAKALYHGVELVSAEGDRIVLSAPNEAHQARCVDYIDTVRGRWKQATGRTVTIAWASGSPAPPTRSAPADDPPAATIDDDEEEHEAMAAIEEDAAVITGPMSAVERVAKAFPGAQRVEQGS